MQSPELFLRLVIAVRNRFQLRNLALDFFQFLVCLASSFHACLLVLVDHLD